MTVLETQSLGDGTNKVISPGGAEPGRWPRAELHSRFPSCELAVQRVQSNHFGVKRTEQKVDCNRTQVKRPGCCCFLICSALPCTPPPHLTPQCSGINCPVRELQSRAKTASGSPVTVQGLGSWGLAWPRTDASQLNRHSPCLWQDGENQESLSSPALEPEK